MELVVRSCQQFHGCLSYEGSNDAVSRSESSFMWGSDPIILSVPLQVNLNDLAKKLGVGSGNLRFADEAAMLEKLKVTLTEPGDTGPVRLRSSQTPVQSDTGPVRLRSSQTPVQSDSGPVRLRSTHLLFFVDFTVCLVFFLFSEYFNKKPAFLICI